MTIKGVGVGWANPLAPTKLKFSPGPGHGRRRQMRQAGATPLAAALVSIPMFVSTEATSAAPIAGAPTTYCADPDTDPSIDTGAGTMISCSTTITNTITGIGALAGSSLVRVVECTGPANGRLDPSVLTCTTDEQVLVNVVTSVEQCNGVGYGGGNVLDCSVTVTNNFVAVTPDAIGAVTVNQCVGSAPVTTGCDPFPATTTNATITQCNNSSYGGGQEDFNCTASGTTTTSLNFKVRQCNDSNYGGGSWLNCSADITNYVTAGPTATPTAALPTATPTAATPTATPTAATPTAALPTATPTAATPTAALPTATPTAQPDAILPVATPSVGPLLPDTSTETLAGPWNVPAIALALGLSLLSLGGFAFVTGQRRRAPRRG